MDDNEAPSKWPGAFRATPHTGWLRRLHTPNM